MSSHLTRNRCEVCGKSVPDHEFNFSLLVCQPCYEGMALCQPGTPAQYKVVNGVAKVPFQHFNTGAVRDTDADKTKWSLLPWKELERVVRETYMPGAAHYGDHNWTKGIPSSRCLESLQRHVLQFSMGDTSEDHLGRAVFNCLAILHNERVFKDDKSINDLPGYTYDA